MLGRDRVIKPAVAPPHAVVTFSRTAPLAALLPAVTALDTADAAAERRASRFGCAGALGVPWIASGFLLLVIAADERVLTGSIADVLGMVPGLDGFDLESAAQVLKMVLLVGYLLAAVLFTILMFVMRSRTKRFDIDDRKLATVEHLFGALAEDVKPNAPVALNLDFRGYFRPDARTASGGYARKWLATRLPLADGSSAELSVATQCKRKTRSKNKYTKIKDSLVEELVVELRPPRGATFAADAAARVRAHVQSPGTRLVRCDVSPRGVRVVLRTAPALRLYTGSWNAQGLERLVDGPAALAAVIRAHRAMRSVLVAAPAAPPAAPPGYGQGGYGQGGYGQGGYGQGGYGQGGR